MDSLTFFITYNKFLLKGKLYNLVIKIKINGKYNFFVSKAFKVIEILANWLKEDILY